eukprot:SAG31_NODE_212_length_20157_cov_9.648868_10_plen_87_part_00
MIGNHGQEVSAGCIEFMYASPRRSPIMPMSYAWSPTAIYHAQSTYLQNAATALPLTVRDRVHLAGLASSLGILHAVVLRVTYFAPP